MLDLLIGIVPAVFLMIIVVGFHEYGHFFVARRLGLNVRRFALGFGRPLKTWTSRKSGVEYSLRAIPLGGFIEIQPHGERSLESAGPLRRALVYAAGPLANILLAFVMFAGLHYSGATRQMAPVIKELVAGSPAERAGLAPGDRIAAIEGVTIDSIMDLNIFAKVMSPTRPLRFTMARDGREHEFTLQRERGAFGIKFLMPEVAGSLGEALANGAENVRHGIAMTFRLPRILWNADRSILSQFNGPVSIAQTTGKTVKAENPFAGLLALAAAISLAIAVANLLPVPVLDGGRIVMCLVEFVTARRPSAAFELGLARVSLAFILSTALLVTCNDLARLFGGDLL